MGPSDDGVSRSPFQPRNPVDPRFFVGRAELLTNIRRVADASQRDRSVSVVYLNGQRRIGKTSLAYYARMALEREVGRSGFHIFLGPGPGPPDLQSFMDKLLRSIIEAKSEEPAVMRRIEHIFRHMIVEVSVGVVKFKQRELAESVPKDASQLLSFLQSFAQKFYTHSNPGFMLILDEIDGVADQAYFAHFLKELIDAGTAGNKRVPLAVLLCGTGERLNRIGRNNPRTCEQMEELPLGLLHPSDVRLFFEKAFDASGLAVTPHGLDVLLHFSDGFPMIMHLIGDAALAVCPTDRPIGTEEAYKCVNEAAERWARAHISARLSACFADPKYERALRYLANPDVESAFTRAAIVEAAGDQDGTLVDALLPRLVEDGVLERGSRRGEYHFVNHLASLAIHRLGVQLRPSLAGEG